MQTTNNEAELKMIGEIVAAYASSNPSATPESVAEMALALKMKMATPASEVPAAPKAEIPSQAAQPVETEAEAPAPAKASKKSQSTAKDKPTPAVPIKDSVSKHKVTCLCCGLEMKMLKRHLGAAHGLTPAAYREMFDLPEDHLLTAPAYSSQKRSLAKMTDFGKYPRAKESKENEKA